MAATPAVQLLCPHMGADSLEVREPERERERESIQQRPDLITEADPSSPGLGGAGPAKWQHGTRFVGRVGWAGIDACLECAGGAC